MKKYYIEYTPYYDIEFNESGIAEDVLKSAYTLYEKSENPNEPARPIKWVEGAYYSELEKDLQKLNEQ